MSMFGVFNKIFALSPVAESALDPHWVNICLYSCCTAVLNITLYGFCDQTLPHGLLLCLMTELSLVHCFKMSGIQFLQNVPS